MLLTTRRLLLYFVIIFFVTALILVYNVDNISDSSTDFIPQLIKPKTLPNNFASLVREAINHSWLAYKNYGWGKDEILVLSHGSSTWMASALTLIDSLDTLKLAGFEKEYQEAKTFYTENIKFTSDSDHTNLFETTIRILGGLISIYEIERDPFVMNEIKILGEKLLHAFDTSSGIPFSDINLKQAVGHRASWTTLCSLSEMSSVQLEFNEISRLTGNYNFTRTSMKTIEILLKQQENTKQYILPIMVNCMNGNVDLSSPISLGSRGDSFYEYLLKVWIQTGRTSKSLKEAYIKSIDEIQTKLIQKSFPNEYMFIGEILSNDIFSTKMDHLVCFLPGTLAYGQFHGMPIEHLELAKELMKSCYQMYNQTSTGLAPEIVYWNTNPSFNHDFDIKPNDVFNKLRPETVESLFYLYRITKDPIYKDWAWKIFKAFNEHCRVEPFGYAGIKDVNDPDGGKIDKMESFWLAETLKYFLLIFDDEVYSTVPLDKFVFNTEAHPMRLTKQSSEINKWKRELSAYFD